MSKNQEKSVVKQGKGRPRKSCLSEATRSILEAVCNDFQNIGVPDSAEKSGQISILCDDLEETNEESVIETDVAVGSEAPAVLTSTDSEEQDQGQIYSDNEQMAGVSTQEQMTESDNDVIVKQHEKNKENVVQCNSHSSFNVTDASENSQMDFVDEGVCEIIDGSAVTTLDRINLLTISAEVVEKNVATSSVTNEDTPVTNKVDKNVLNPKSSISVSALNSVPGKNRNKLPFITAMASHPRMGLPVKTSGVSERTKQLCQEKNITLGRKAAILKMSQSSRPARRMLPLPPRTERYSSTRSTLKARRITAKMKQAWALQLQKDGHLTCPVPGCSQSYVTIANLITHYKWCSGKKSLQHCIYCSSLIIADQDAVLHHIKVEHPEKLEEYKEKLPAKHLVERQEATCKGDLDSGQELPTGKTGLYQASGNCVAKTLSKKYQRLNKHSKTKLRAKENILKPWKTCLKKRVKIIDEEEPYDKKCVRFNDIVEKIKSVEDKPAEPDIVTPAPATTVCSNTNTLFPGILENAFLPDEVDDILDITECEDLPPTNYFDLSDEENVDDSSESQIASVVAQKKSRCFKVLDTHGFKRFSEYLKLTRDWASERRTYSRSKHCASSDTPTVLQPAAAVEDVADIHQLHDTPEPSKISLGASETELNQNEITPYCSIPQEEPNKDSPIFDNLVSQLSDRGEVTKRSSSVDPARSTQPEFSAIHTSPERQVESAVSKEQPSQNNTDGACTAPAVQVNSVNTVYKSPVSTPKSYRPLIKVRVTCYDNACKEDAVQKPFGAKSPVTLDKTVANLCKSLQTPPPVPDFDSLIKSCVPTAGELSQRAVTIPKKRGRRPKNNTQCPLNLAKQLPDSVIDDNVKKGSSVTNPVLAESAKQSNTTSPVLGDGVKKAFSIRENGIKLPPGNTVVDGVVVKRKRGRPRKNQAEQVLPPAEDTAKLQAVKTESPSTSSRKIVHKCKWCADCDSEYNRIIKRKRNSTKGIPGTHIFPGAESLSSEQLAIINTVSNEQVVVSEHLPAVIKYLKTKKKIICSKKVKCKESKLHKMARRPGRPRMSHRTKKVDASTQVSQDIDLCSTSSLEQNNAHMAERVLNLTNNDSSNVGALLGPESLKNVADVEQHVSVKSALTSPAASIQVLPRRRGRPRKYALPEVISPAAINSNSSVVTTMSGLNTQQSGDGNAKGYVVLPSEPGGQILAKNNSPSNNTSCATVPQQILPVTPKRGRGRPRKFPVERGGSGLPLAMISNNIVHNNTVAVTTPEKDINSYSFEKGNIEIPGGSVSTFASVNNISTEEETNRCSASVEAMQVCESLNKSSETVTAVPNVENTGLQDPVSNSISADANMAVSGHSPGNEVQDKQVDAANICASLEVPIDMLVTTVPNIDTSAVARVEHEVRRAEEPSSCVTEGTDANDLVCPGSSMLVTENRDSSTVAEVNSSTADVAISDKHIEEKVHCENLSDTSDNANQASASSVTNSENHELVTTVPDALNTEKVAIELNICGTDISHGGSTDAVAGSVSSSEIPHEVPANVSVECTSTTENNTSCTACTPDEHITEINGETPVDSSIVLSKSDAELQLSEDSGGVKVLAAKESTADDLPKQDTCANRSDEKITVINSSIGPSLSKDSPPTDMPLESPKMPQKTGKRGRPRKYPVGTTPKSSGQSDAAKHERSSTLQQKTPVRTSSRQRSSRRLCIDDTCMDKCHVGFRTHNLKSNSAELGSAAKSSTKSMHVENVASTVPVEVVRPNSRNNGNVDAGCTLTVGKDEKPGSVEERDSQHLVSDLCSAVEAEIVKVDGLSSQKAPEGSNEHELVKVPCEPKPSSEGTGSKKAVEICQLQHVHKVPKRRGRRRKIRGVDNKPEENLTSLSSKNVAASINSIRSSGGESSNGTGNLPVNTAAPNGFPRKCSRKGLPRKCVRYAVINSGVDSDTLEDESLGINSSHEEDKKTRKKARLEKSKSDAPEITGNQPTNEPSSKQQVVGNSAVGERGTEADVHSAVIEENNKENSIIHLNENEVSSCGTQGISNDKKSKTMKTPVKLKIRGKKRKRNCEESSEGKELKLGETSTERPCTDDIQNTAESMELEVQPEQGSTPENATEPPSKKRKLPRRAAVRARKMLVGFIKAEKSEPAVPKKKSESRDLDYDAAGNDKSENESEEEMLDAAEDYDVEVELAKYKEFYYMPKPTIREVSSELLENWCDLLSKGKKVVCEYKDCKRAFKSKIGIRDHYINSVCQKRWKCLKCNKFLKAGASTMLRHMLSSHNEKTVGTDACNDTEGGVGKQKTSSTPRKNVRVPDVSAFQWTLEFHKKYSCTDLMPKWKPKKSLWKLQDSKEYEDYLPPLKKSINIATENSENWFSLNYFESTPVKGNESSHCTFFAGGPIWAAAWCPTPFDVMDTEQFVALATANKMDSDNTVLPATEGKGLLQLWSVGKLKKDMKDCKPTLSLAVKHDYGTVWDMSWCPFGCWEDPVKYLSEEDLPRLGLLAVACSDSSVYIYSIPHPGTLVCDASHLPVFATHPSVILQCDYGEPCLATSKSMCTCISWQRTDGCELLAGGFSNGMICVWHITSESSLLVNCNENLQTTIIPFLSIPAHSAAVTGLCFAGMPGGRWLSSCGFDRVTKIWDLEDTSLPVSTIPKKLARSVQWMSHWNGVFITKDDTSNATTYKECGYYNYAPRLLIPHNAGIWSCSLSEWLNTAVSCDAAGEVAGNALCHLFKNVDSLKQLHDRRFPVFRTEIKALEDGCVIPEQPGTKETCMANGQEQDPSKCSLPSDSSGSQNNVDVPEVAAGVAIGSATAIVETIEDMLDSVVVLHDCCVKIDSKLNSNVSQSQNPSDEMSMDISFDPSSTEVNEENDSRSHQDDLDVRAVASCVIDEAALVVQTVEDMVQDVVQHVHSSEIPCDGSTADQHLNEEISVMTDLEFPSKQNDVKHLDAVTVSACVISDATEVVQTMEDVLQRVSQIPYHENGEANHYHQLPGGVTDHEKLPDKGSEPDVVAISAGVINEATVIVEMVEDILRSIHCAGNSEIKAQNRKMGSEVNFGNSSNHQDPNEIDLCKNQDQFHTKCRNHSDDCDSSLAVSEISTGVTDGENVVIQSMEDMLQHVCLDVDSSLNINSEDRAPFRNENGEVENCKSPLNANICGGKEVSVSGKSSEQSDVSLVASDVLGDIIAVVQTMKFILKNLDVNGSSESFCRYVLCGSENRNVVSDLKSKVPMNAEVQSVSEIIQDCKVVVEDMCLKTENYFKTGSSNLDQMPLAKNSASQIKSSKDKPLNNGLHNHNDSDASVFSENFIADCTVVFSADIVKLVQEMISNVASIGSIVCQNSNKIEIDETEMSCRTIPSDLNDTFSEKLLQKYSTATVKENILRSGVTQNHSGLAADIVNDLIEKVENLLRNSVSDGLSENSISDGAGKHTSATGALNNNIYQTVSSVLNLLLKKVVDMSCDYAQVKPSDQSVKNTPLEPSDSSVQMSESSTKSQEVSSLERTDRLIEKPSDDDHQADKCSTADDEEMEIDALLEDTSQSVRSDEQNSFVSMEEDMYSNIGSVDFIVVDEASCEPEDDCSLETKDSNVSDAENYSGVVDIPGDSLSSELLTEKSGPCLDIEKVSTKELSFAGVEGDTSSETGDVYVYKESNKLTGLSNENKLEKSLDSIDSCQVCPEMLHEGDNIDVESCGVEELNSSVVDLNCVKETLENIISHIADNESFVCVHKNVLDEKSGIDLVLAEDRTAATSEPDTMQCIEDTIEHIVSSVCNSPPNIDFSNDVPETLSVVCETNVNGLESSVKPVVLCSAAEQSSDVTAIKDPDTVLCVEKTVEDIVSLVSSMPSTVFKEDACSEIAESSNEICETKDSDTHISEKAVVTEVPSFDMTASSEVNMETLQCVEETVQSIVSLVCCTPLEKDSCAVMTESSDTINETNVTSLEPTKVVVSGSGELLASNVFTSVDADVGDNVLCAVGLHKSCKRVHALVETDISDDPPPKRLKMTLSEELAPPNAQCDNNSTNCQNESNPVLLGKTDTQQPVNNINSVCREIPPSSISSEGHLSDSVVFRENNLAQSLSRHKGTSNLDILDKYENISKRFGLFFKDADLRDFRKLPESEIKRLKKSESMTAASPDKYDVASVNTVKWNPNYGSHLWLFTGGQAGIARLSLVKALDCPQTDTKFSKKPQQKR